MHGLTWLDDAWAVGHINILQLPEKRPDYRKDRDHSTFLTRLHQAVSSDRYVGNGS